MGIVMDADLSDDERKFYSNRTEDEKIHQRERKIRESYISDEELEVLREKYSHSVVQDFGDEFHLTKDERERIEKEHEKLFRLKNMRNRCPRLSEYVIQWRLCLEIINDMAESNGVMDPEKFKKDVLNGKIYINGMRFPKYNGKRKKYINWDYIMNDYILDTTKDPYELDVNHFDQGEEIEIDEDDEIDPDIQFIIDHSKLKTDDEILHEIQVGDADELSSNMTSKEVKEMKKMVPEVFRSLQAQQRIEKKRQRARMSIYEADEDDFDYIARYDKKHRMKNSSAIPEFKGNIMKDKDFDKYMGELEDYDDEHTLIKYNGRFYTPDEMREIEIKNLLEENGWNLRKCFIDKEAEKRRKAEKKRDEKKEKKIKKMLMEIKARKEDRDEKLYGLPQGINAKELKKSKKKKKKKDKRIKQFDEILLDTSRSMHSTFEEYSKEMEDFRWGK